MSKYVMTITEKEYYKTIIVHFEGELPSERELRDVLNGDNAIIDMHRIEDDDE